MSKPQAARTAVSPHNARDADLEHLQVDKRLEEEMDRLATINRELLGVAGPTSGERYGCLDETDELTVLRSENAELRARLEELEQALQAPEPKDSVWAERQKEYENLLEEKSEVIRSFHLKIQQLQEAGGSAAAEGLGTDSQRIQLELQEQRRQLEEDEESLMSQMRQMEVAMSKDRAELARQRNEIQRLHSELNHEIENASRDPGLRERLVALQRLQVEITGRKPTTQSHVYQAPPPPGNRPLPAAKAAPAKKESSGLLRRIFGK